MNVGEFLKSRAPVLFLNLMGVAVLLVFLFSVGNEGEVLVQIAAVWFLVMAVYLMLQYKSRKTMFRKLEKSVENLDKKYVISEVIEPPILLEAKPYYNLLKIASKSMREEINIIRDERKEYKEYVEQWIHEVKTPIASIRLIEENNKTSTSRIVLNEVENIDRYVEQALFYARSEEAQKDYLIKEISLEESINKVIIKNKQMFILNQIDLDIEHADINVFCDSKWLEFILDQIVVNAIKYRTDENPKVKISCEEVKNAVLLSIEDNGMGVPKEDLSRVFEKGFTGKLGRVKTKSTGIGLYLCKRLCEKLGLLIAMESEPGEFTKVVLTFPKGSYAIR